MTALPAASCCLWALLTCMGCRKADWTIAQEWGHLETPRSIAVTPDQRILVAMEGADQLAVLLPDGSVDDPIGTGRLHGPWGVSCDDQGRIWATDSDEGQVLSFGADGEELSAWDGDGALESPIAVTSTIDGLVLVTDLAAGRVQVFTATGALVDTWDDNYLAPSGIAVDAAARVYIADSEHDRILRRFVNGAEAEELLDLARRPRQLAPHPDGSLLIAAEGDGHVASLSADGTLLTSIGEGLTEAPWGVGVLADGRIVVSEPTRGEVLLLAPVP